MLFNHFKQKVLCSSKQKNDAKVKLGILVRESLCFEEYFSLDGHVSLLIYLNLFKFID